MASRTPVISSRGTLVIDIKQKGKWYQVESCPLLRKFSYKQRFFFRENQNCPWKLFWPFFDFFTDGKWLSRTLFSNFSRAVEIFHGHFVRFFHGWVFFFTGGKWKNLHNFHARLFFFTGTKIDNIHKGFFHIQNLQHFGRLIISDTDYGKRQTLKYRIF